MNKIYGLLRVRDEGPIIKDTLNHLAEFCEAVFVYDDCSEDDTLEVCSKHPIVKSIINGKEWDLNRERAEFQNRQAILKEAKKYADDKDWFINIDADERVEFDWKKINYLDDEIVAIRMKLFDFYITPEDINYKYFERKWIGPEYRKIIMAFRNTDRIKYEIPDQREVTIGGGKILDEGYVKHYGKALSIDLWERKCDYYINYFPKHSEKWKKRKGKAVHNYISDFGLPLIKWEDKESKGFSLSTIENVKLNVLLTNHHLLDYTGSENYTFTLAKYLKKNNCNVYVYSKYLDKTLEDFRELNIPVVENLEEIKNIPFDIAHVHHNINAAEIRYHFPNLPIVFLSHGVIPFLEQPPFLNIDIDQYLAVSEEVKDNLIKHNIPREKIIVLGNLIANDLFYPVRPINRLPKKLLVLSSKLNEEKKEIIDKACQKLKISVNYVGSMGKEVPQAELPDLINNSDIVISLGRGAIESMLCKRQVIVFDRDGGDGLITPDNFEFISYNNFSGRAYKKHFNVEELMNEIKKYDPESSELLYNKVYYQHSVEIKIKYLIKIYQDVISNSKKVQINDNKKIEDFLKSIEVTRQYSKISSERRYEKLIRNNQEITHDKNNDLTSTKYLNHQNILYESLKILIKKYNINSIDFYSNEIQKVVNLDEVTINYYSSYKVNKSLSELGVFLLDEKYLDNDDLLNKLKEYNEVLIFFHEKINSKTKAEIEGYFQKLGYKEIFNFSKTHSLSFFRKRDCKRITFILPTLKLHGGIKVALEHAKYLFHQGNIVTIVSPEVKKPNWINIEGLKFIASSLEISSLIETLPDAEYLIATLWNTAYLVNSAPYSKGRKIYFIQGYESFWSEFPEDVDRTYVDLPLKKIVVSKYLQNLLKENYKQDSFLVTNGVDFCDLTSNIKPKQNYEIKGSIKIGMLFSNVSVKAFDIGYKAFQEFKSKYKNAKLALYGTVMPDKKKILYDEFLLMPDRKTLSEFFSSLDMFVYTSINEGFGLPPLEAMAHGVPVIMTKFGGNIDYINENNCLLNDVGDVQGIVENMIKLAENTELRESIGKKAYHSTKNFSLTKSNEIFHKTLNSISDYEDKLKILFVGAGPVWADAYIDPFLINGFKELGHEVIVFNPKPENWLWENRFVNLKLFGKKDQAYKDNLIDPKELIDFAIKQKPDLVFFNHALLIDSEIINELKKKKIPTAVWMIDEPQEMIYSANRGRLFDYVFLQDEGSLNYHLKNGNSNSFYMPHGIDPQIHRPRKNQFKWDENYFSDILLIGTGFPKRREFVSKLIHLGYKIRLIGRNWDGLEANNVIVQEPVSFEEAAKYYRNAKITINIHRRNDDYATSKEIPMPLSPNGSFFYISGCGSLQFIDDEFNGAENFLIEDYHYIKFLSVEDLKNKINYFLNNEDERLERVVDAQNIIHARNKYSDRLKDCLNIIRNPVSQKRIYGLKRKGFDSIDPFDSSSCINLFTTFIYVQDDIEKLKTFLGKYLKLRSSKNKFVILCPDNSHIKNWLNENKIYFITYNKGQNIYDSVNKSFQVCESEYLVFVNANILPPINFDSRLVETLEKQKEYGIISAELLTNLNNNDFVFDSINQFNNYTNKVYLENKFNVIETNNLNFNAFAIRREVIESAGMLNINSLNNESGFPVEYLEKVNRIGWRTGKTNSVLYLTLSNSHSTDTLKHHTKYSSSIKNVSVIVPIFNNLKYTRDFYNSISKIINNDLELLFIDNASNDGTPNYLQELSRKNQNIKTIRNNQNLGFPSAVNQGIAYSQSKYILIANNDIIVTKGWLDRLIEIAESDPKIGIVGPISNEVSGLQKDPDAKYNSIEEMHKYAAQVREKNKGHVLHFPRVAFLCTLIKREVIEKIGGLDERFSPGNYEDDDFCLRAQLAGYKTVIAKDVFIHHFGSKSFKANGEKAYHERLLKNQKIFVDKWGATPDEIWLKNKQIKPHQIFYPIDKNMFQQHFRRVRVHLADNELELAQTEIEKAIENYHEGDATVISKVDLLDLAGNLFLASNNLEKAQYYFEQELQLSPNSSNACLGLGKVLFATNQPEAAKVMFEYAVKNNPANSNALSALAEVNALLGLEEQHSSHGVLQ
ncbi:MAG: glycosyltransferase [Ignavibacterium sp.]|jgi:GT2 family glycosyltransferase|uniref:glycosyltransferase n=1 Tax=Ignavibacterium sp. TaxID=2651167 RepID=UPI0032983185